MVMAQVGEASMESEQERRHGMTGTEWRVATALFTVGEVTASLTLLRPQHDSALLSDTSSYLVLAHHPPSIIHTCADTLGNLLLHHCDSSAAALGLVCSGI